MPEAELVIAPEIAMADLRRSMDILDRSMKKAAKEAGDNMKEELERGIVAGAKRGARRAGSALRSGFDKMGGGKAVGGGLVAGLMAGIGVNIQRADEGTAAIQARLSEGSNRAMMGTASLLGVDAATIKKLWSMGQAAGFDDYRDFADILTNIQLKVTEAETGEDPSLNQFKGLRGAAMLEAVFSSIAASPNEMRTYWLDKFEAGERLSEMERFLQALPKGETVIGGEGGTSGIGPDGKYHIGITGGVMKSPAWLTLTEAEKAAGLTVEEYAKREEQFKQAQIGIDANRQAQEMAAIGPGKIAAYISEQQRITAETVKVIQTYEENLAAAIPVRKAISEGMTALGETTSAIAKDLSAIVSFLKEGEWVEALRYLNGGRNFLDNSSPRGG